MKAYNPKYIVPLLLPALLAGCADDELLTSGNPAGNPDAITFAAFTVDAVEPERTRGAEKPLYDPLTLSGDSDDSPLYLHTYETNRIGYRPGEETGEATTRGVQVTTGNLAEIHKNFIVVANKSIGGSTYFNWKETHLADAENNVWYTSRTEYWPASENLTFHAVSPAVEFDNLSDLSAHEGEITFGYSARKGTADNDAELQHDLLLSSYSCNKQTHTGKVPLKFNHALSAVKFAVRDVLDGEVVNIKIAGVRSSGVCTFKPGEISWENQDGTATYSQNFNYKLKGQEIVDVTDDSKDKVLNETMPEKTFMLIPQQIPDDAEIIVTLKRDNVSAPAKSEITVKGKIKANGVEEWKPGHEYIYTISTSKDNWVYVFDAKGNAAEGDGNIYVYSPNDDKFEELQNTAYYSVRSYRYRANQQSHVENLPWNASFTGSESYEVNGSSDMLYEGKWISAEKWITDLSDSKFSGEGSKEYKRHDIEMYPHYLMTDWAGDKKMQLNAPYNQAMLNKDTPYDLSKPNGQARSTANCYIVDRGGWYCLPLVYGNAIVRGSTNATSYKCSKNNASVLQTFTDYKGNNINSPYISGGAGASLVWQDAYDMLSEVELVKVNGEDMIRFFVDKDNLQQGNAIVALKDAAGTIMWSWHIWATEHWLDNKGLPNAMSNDAFFNFKLNDVTLVRESGDSKVTYNQANRTFYMSPYNLGWCDPKNVIYLKRKSTMVFTQYQADKATEIATVSLPIIQQGETVNYKIGNNPYYQWGRKDPQVGFVDREKNFKANFGPTSFKMENNANITIADGIRNPHKMYVHTTAGSPPADQQDWLKSSYWNLWNNSSNVNTSALGTAGADAFSHLKTVYDPSPMGYVVPNSGVWLVLGGTNSMGGTAYPNDPKFGGHLNGKTGRKLDAIPDGIFVYEIYGTGSASDQSNFIYLIPTGNRWYSDGHVFTQDAATGQETTIKAGLNFNLRMFYGWSSQWLSSQTNRGCYAGAVGMDASTTMDYYLGPKFMGRRAMGRPVRAIRDPNF